MALQIALGIATCLLLSVVGSRVVGPGAGRLAGLLLALYPTHVMYSTLRLTEPLFTLLMLGAIGILSLARTARGDPAVVAGLVLGLAVLTRPLIVLLPFLLPLGLATKGQDEVEPSRRLFLVSVDDSVDGQSVALAESPTHRSMDDADHLGRLQFLGGQQPEARGGYVRRGEIEASLAVGDEFDWHRGYAMGSGCHPRGSAGALQRLPLKISHLVALETDGVLWNLKGFAPAPGLSAVLILLLLANVAYLLALGTATLALLGRKDLPLFGRLTVLLCVYMLAIVMVFFGDPRFHLPLMPFLLLFSASLFRGRRGMALAPSRRGPARITNTAHPLDRPHGDDAGFLMVLNLAVKHAEGAW